jgi:hypothetical protein
MNHILHHAIRLDVVPKDRAGLRIGPINNPQEIILLADNTNIVVVG